MKVIEFIFNSGSDGFLYYIWLELIIWIIPIRPGWIKE